MAKKATTKATPDKVASTEEREIKESMVEKLVQEETIEEIEILDNGEIDDSKLENKYETLSYYDIASLLDTKDNTTIIVIGDNREDSVDVSKYVKSFLKTDLKLDNTNLTILINESQIKYVGTSPDAFRGYDPDLIIFTTVESIENFYEKYGTYLDSLRGKKFVLNTELTDDERYGVYLNLRKIGKGLTHEQHSWLSGYINMKGLNVFTPIDLDIEEFEAKKTKATYQEPSLNSNKMINDITTFMTVMKQYVGSDNIMPSIKNIKLRRDLAIEELTETREAFAKIETTISALLASGKTASFDENDNIHLVVELMDGFIDQLVILAGTGITYGTNGLNDLFTDIFEAFLTGTKDIEIPDTNKNLISRVALKFEKIEYFIELMYNESLEQYLLGNTHYYQSRFHIGNILINILESMKILGVDNKEMLQEIWDEIQRANMSKLDENGEPVFLPSGKVTKSKLYKAPELKSIVEKYTTK